MPIILSSKVIVKQYGLFLKPNKFKSYIYSPRAEATTANALAVVFRTYSSMLSISGLIVEIMVARPAALAKLEIISRPSTRA